ncbi:hypothetical protein BTN50_0484 [Candidatus Enterovibrio altilux]|uniref:Uncharacterized protein n=1 Tax=Candidatus Enterovibrio altilux TaxID=1927128 RepID=A0A291B7P5_9GAMM|nr:hypothetical protein BTN50_0484 [Candidatus Enterovibrio luxaltus]
MKKLFSYGIKLSRVIRGRLRLFNDLAIVMALMVKCLFSMPMGGQQ